MVSQSRDQAREFYYRVLNLFKRHPILFSLIEKETQAETRLFNGSRIMNRAVGTEGVSIRGLSIDLLIVDEADFIPELVFNAIEATQASSDGNLILISTPNKKGSTFYKYFQDGMEARREYEQGLIPENVDPILTNKSIFPLHQSRKEYETFRKLRSLSQLLNDSLDRGLQLFSDEDIGSIIKKVIGQQK